MKTSRGFWVTAIALAFTISAAAQSNDAKGQYASVNGLKMYYEIHGAGKPLVLLHGAFGFVEGWGAVLPSLAKTHQVIAVELQGHGHTNDLEGPLANEQMADDVAALLRQLQIKDADVFGYSMGLHSASRFAIRNSCGGLPFLGRAAEI
jgi:pimeloyl-ACP methyl ester carboxylesterase